MKKKISIIFSLFIILLTVSCTVSQNFVFTKGVGQTSGSNRSDIKASAFFSDVMEDLSSWQSADSGKGAVQDAIENYANTVKSAPHAYDVGISENDKNNYTVSFSFTDLQAVISEISGVENQNIFTVSKKGSRTRVEFNLDMNNYNTLTRIIPFLAEENFAVYGPEYNNGMSEEEYLEMIGFVLGEEGPDCIRDSVITVNITLPSWLSASNGKSSGRNSVVYSIPLIDFLLLNKPIRLWCEF